MTAPRQSRFHLLHRGWLLLAVAVLAVAYVGLSVWLPSHREQQIIQLIGTWKGSVAVERHNPEWLRRLVNENRLNDFSVFDRVIKVDLAGQTITDEDIARLGGLSELKSLDIERTAVTDIGLAQLASCTKLESLYLSDTQVTDAGLYHFRQLPKLKILYLNRTAVGDDGLAHLRRMTSLEWLWLERTSVTDAGLTRLSGLKNLKRLYLGGTSVTDDGASKLKAVLPGCWISR